MSGATEFVLDFARERRTGLEEAIYCAGKSPAQIDAILAAARERGASLFLTRLSPDRFAALASDHRGSLDYCEASQTAVFGTPRPVRGAAEVAVVCAGTSDVGVAREAVRTLAYHGAASTLIADVGVAGLWRLTERLDELRTFPVIIAVAGMDAALPTVLGGLVASAIVAVPTSVGYGVATGGRVALDAILASCAPGLGVVNIDNGFGAACLALRLLNAARAIAARPTEDR
ncbi:Pyridinium-3,5-biscarboxylic acid mononucleotide synthase [Beijerinckiaceae bacterium RH AL1]|nr:nickel pincer cofactor biosynthesis protein LarB [Beijerinckiaceae bacterium]VVB48595.1 Pyridinium-3,5-biscarboxylic acid mononucleotide synthase [Beijerinckiaceae bacterium RH CH11]VVB48676.1 Pyridinium-3,5-biscarboxylic acid mononucleotide synthase [Beijerinckiaceae bacterium RH AL8]VVC56473.1 Pyridinium-3,5-biscarboxylic acid mononucleotide synthase [Beijerinckiaceae bacterium RH AL1]